MSFQVSVAELIEDQVLSGKGRMISTSDLIFLVRASIAQCEHSDDELAQLIAAIAIRHGCNLSFGTPQPESELASGRRYVSRLSGGLPYPAMSNAYGRLSADNDERPDGLSATG